MNKAIICLAVILSITSVGIVSGQQRGSGTGTGSGGGAGGGAGATDPAMIRAREEVAVVLDLGRLIGFVHRVDTEVPHLAITPGQAQQLVRIMQQIRTTSRLTPRIAEAMMLEIEDSILTGAQLLQVDRFWAEADRLRESGTAPSDAAARQGAEGSGPGALSSYVAGGPYNPLIDTNRPQGQDFEAFLTRLQQR